MVQSRNDQSQPEQGHPKPRGRFTGQRLKVLRPDTYRRAVELLAEPREHVPYDHICRLLRVSKHTVKAIQAAESLPIAERKQRLLAKALRIAHKAADRIEDQIESANVTQATVVFGVAVDKINLLAGDPTAILEVNPGPGFADLYEKLNAMRPGNVPDLQSSQRQSQRLSSNPSPINQRCQTVKRF